MTGAITQIHDFPRPGHAHRRPRRILAGTAVALTLVLIGGLGGTRPRWYLPVDAGICLAAMAAFALALTGVARLRWRWVLLPVTLVVCLPLAQLALHTTADRSATEAAFVQLLAAALTFLLLVQVGDDRSFSEGLLQCLAAAGGALALFGLAQRMLSPDAIYGTIRVRNAVSMGPFIDADDFAAAMTLLLPAAMALGLSGGGRSGTRWGWLTIAGLDLAAAVTSASRGGAIGIGLDLLLIFLLLPPRRRRGGSTGRARAWRHAAAALPLLFVLAAGVTPLLARFGSSRVSAATRLALDRSSLAMGAARPFWGQGLGTWELVYPDFARFDDGLIYEFAHCDYAQWWAETGLTGCALALWTLAAFAWTTRAYWRDRLGAPLLIGLAGFCAHAGVDFLWHIPSLALLFALMAGAAIARESKSRRRHTYV